MRGAVERANEIAAELKGAFVPQPFRNPANPDVHFRTTGPEIWEDSDGRADVLVAGVGTGGTLTGVARFVKPRKRGFEAIAVEPAASPVLSGGSPGRTRIQGIGAGFVPEVLDGTLVDRVITVDDEQAMEMARRLRLRAAQRGQARGHDRPRLRRALLQTALFERFRYQGSDGVEASAFRFPPVGVRA